MEIYKQFLIKLQLNLLKDLFILDNFETVSKLLRNSKTIRKMNRILNIIYNKKVSQKFSKIVLTCFVSSQFTDILTNAVNIEDDIISNNIHKISKKLVFYFNSIRNSNKVMTNYYCKKIKYHSKDLINNYKIWEKDDCEKILNELVITYLEYEDYKENREEIKPYIEEQQESIIKKATSLNKDIGKEYFEAYLKSYNDYKKYLEDLGKGIEQNMNRAFWDIIVRDLDSNPPKFLSLIPLLEDTRILLISCVPNMKQIHSDINEKIDTPFIKSMIENDALDKDYIYKMVDYIISYVKDFQSRAEDQKTDTWLKEILVYLDENKYGKFFYEFFKVLFEKLEKIIKDSNIIRNLIKNKDAL